MLPKVPKICPKYSVFHSITTTKFKNGIYTSQLNSMERHGR
jgi:hypothetical protein